MTTPTYRITGNTYRNRHAIKNIAGATWKPAEKAWYVTIGGNGSTDTLWALRNGGCKVEEVSKTAPAVSAATQRRAWTRSEASVQMHATIDEPESFPMQPHEFVPNVCEYCGIETCPDGCCCGC